MYTHFDLRVALAKAPKTNFTGRSLKTRDWARIIPMNLGNMNRCHPEMGLWLLRLIISASIYLRMIRIPHYVVVLAHTDH
jgi:hypothetical protein